MALKGVEGLERRPGAPLTFLESSMTAGRAESRAEVGRPHFKVTQWPQQGSKGHLGAPGEGKHWWLYVLSSVSELSLCGPCGDLPSACPGPFRLELGNQHLLLSLVPHYFLFLGLPQLPSGTLREAFGEGSPVSASTQSQFGC